MATQADKAKTTIKVTVTFPISPKKPFHAEEPAVTTIGAVREAAMSYFGVTEDSQFAYYFTHSGERTGDDATVGDVAGHAGALKFTLIKELVQGS